MTKAHGTARVAPGVCLATMILGLAGCERKTQTDAPAPVGDVPAARRVETVPVTRESLRRVSDAVPAHLLPYETTDLHARISGYVKEVRADYGDRVKKGTVLAVLAVPEMEVELRQKEALVRQAEAELRLGRAAVASAEAEFKRMKSQSERMATVGRGGLISVEAVEETQHGFEASTAKRDVARADVGVKEAKLEVAREHRDHVKTLLGYARIETPYDAVVIGRHLHTGAFIGGKAGEQPLFTVARTDVLRVVVDVPEKEVRYLDKGDKVVIDLDAMPGQKFEWKITRLAPVLGQGKKARVEVDLPNTEGTLYPGMYGRVAVFLEEKPHGLSVPVSCLGSDGEGSFVWLVVGGKSRRQRVQVGIQDGDRVEVVSGLTGAEEVIRGGDGLEDGQPVLARRADNPARR